MLSKNMSKIEIEKALENKGDFTKIDYLTRFLEEKPPLSLKRFAYNRLADLYKKKKMFLDSGRMFENLGEASMTFSDKIKCFINSSKMYIEAGKFERADYSLKKALHNANFQEKRDLYYTIKEFYIKKAKEYEREDKRANAVKIYEKIFDMKLGYKEKKEIKEKLMDLYQKLGRFQSYNLLKDIK